MVVAGLAAIGCSVEEALPAPNCFSDGSALIAAQSVPGGSFVPCLEPLPAGWEIGWTSISESGTEFRLDSDRIGEGSARLRYQRECDPGEAVPILSNQDGVERLRYRENLSEGFRERTYFVFEGGCVWWDVDFEGASTVGEFDLSLELTATLQLLTRDEVNQSIRDTFIDEEL